MLSTLDRLKIAFSNLENIQPHFIHSPSYQPRRASVAIIIRIIPTNLSRDYEENNDSINSLEDFWNFPWVKDGEPEILYIKRALREGDRWSGQMAFPGGKRDSDDVDDLDTAERETFEEGKIIIYNFF